MSNQLRRKLWSLLASLPLTMSAACGGGSNAPATPPPPNSDGGGSSSSLSIGPGGGTLESSDGTMDVIVPAGALAQTITLTIEPATSPLDGAVGRVYEIGPTGTTFAVPVTVLVHYGDADDLGSIAPGNVAVSTVVAGKWQNLPGAALDAANQTIAGLTYHLSPYSLALITPATPLPYPACKWNVQQGDFCPAGVNAGDLCAYADANGDITTAYCDGDQYETATAPVSCPASQPAGGAACGYFARTCQYFAAPGGSIPNGCVVTCSCADGAWSCHDDCSCVSAATTDSPYGAPFTGTLPFNDGWGIEACSPPGETSGTCSANFSAGFCATGTSASCLAMAGSSGVCSSASEMIACACMNNVWSCTTTVQLTYSCP